MDGLFFSLFKPNRSVISSGVFEGSSISHKSLSSMLVAKFYFRRHAEQTVLCTSPRLRRKTDLIFLTSGVTDLFLLHLFLWVNLCYILTLTFSVTQFLKKQLPYLFCNLPVFLGDKIPVKLKPDFFVHYLHVATTTASLQLWA